jgi:ssDNA-binding Zn-finger/Zn-ribbon topoisomerase 1
MILFKACPKCGGDLDATWNDDVYCVQCGKRPRVAFPGPRILTDAEVAMLKPPDGLLHPPCPQCASKELVILEKARPDYNTCIRCFTCGHIYSPNARKWR